MGVAWLSPFRQDTAVRADMLDFHSQVCWDSKAMLSGAMNHQLQF